MSNTPVSLAEIKKVASPIIPIKLNLVNKYRTVVCGRRVFATCKLKYDIIARIMEHRKMFFMVVFSSCDALQKPCFFSPWMYWYKETNAEIEVDIAIPI